MFYRLVIPRILFESSMQFTIERIMHPTPTMISHFVSEGPFARLPMPTIAPIMIKQRREGQLK